MCGYFCIGFTDSMLKGKSLLKHTNSFSPNEYKEKGKIIFSIKSKKFKMYCNVCNKSRKSKKTKSFYCLQ